ncbi:hypothetical protein BUALT_Bualt16G0005700 [Buddleja alternifolia]|uniref:DUF7950 domain-containing protein n=1 Tax=Buddleja alternifolia TaxID=168488 RepID=A0AAV6WE72_9LAMI|nr:hypothetical protein BUALT_Bualt16G0005700 [Buddleja alternifolia]
MNRIMLRFRPIAPKPVGGEAASGKAEEDRLNGVVKRTKRKYVRVRGRQSKQCSMKKILAGEKSPPPERSGTEEESSPEKVTVTLQLLPERSEIRDNHKICDNSANNYKADDVVSYEVTAAAVAPPRSVGSVTKTMVIVERVTDTYTDVGLGFSDRDKMESLEGDTCPGFISDGENNVIWVNEAYKKMVAEEEAAAAEGFLVWLVVKEELPRFCPSFACRARLVQDRGQGHKWNRIVPCDVWRMGFADGFAWKLDVSTALSLSL